MFEVAYRPERDDKKQGHDGASASARLAAPAAAANFFIDKTKKRGRPQA